MDGPKLTDECATFKQQARRRLNNPDNHFCIKRTRTNRNMCSTEKMLQHFMKFLLFCLGAKDLLHFIREQTVASGYDTSKLKNFFDFLLFFIFMSSICFYAALTYMVLRLAGLRVRMCVVTLLTCFAIYTRYSLMSCEWSFLKPME